MKKIPPAPGPIKNLDFPEIPASRLGNRMEVVNVESDYLPRISVTLGIPVGRLHDPEGKRGMAQLVSDLMKEGTRHRTSREVAGEIDRYAIDYSCRVYLEYTLVRFKFLENFLEEALDLLADILLGPLFPEEEWGKAAIRWKGYLAAQSSNPSYLARERIYAELFPGSPLSNCTIDRDSIDSLTTGDFKDFHVDRFSPASGIIGFSGPLTQEESLELGERFFGKVEANHLSDPPVPEVIPTARKVCLVDRPGSEQAKIMVGLHAPSRKVGDQMPLKLLSQVFGGGASSRLFMNLREDKGYTYGAYSSLKQSNYSGAFLVSTSVNNGVVSESLREIFREMEELKAREPGREELDRCKAEINGVFLRQMETPASICSMEVTRRLVGRPDGYYREFIPSLMAVRPGQVQAAARDLFDPEQAIVVVVGDRERIDLETA